MNPTVLSTILTIGYLVFAVPSRVLLSSRKVIHLLTQVADRPTVQNNLMIMLSDRHSISPGIFSII
ncbi:hypothetical protein ACE1CA_30825 [Aerosakkonemataceae cyanobacterium BLCC-F167]|uniref:Uncharacterized protein n=2 Tax=Floridanema TaxID=3396149 RepID=A0ABV4WV05_9CYAN